MKIRNIGTWLDVKEATLNTVGKKAVTDGVSTKLKYQLLYSEHSPIRNLTFKWTWIDLKYWVSMHLVRHVVGISHWISTQRTDRTGEDRNSKPQDSPVDHMCTANAQTIINISRKRLCMCASAETRAAWQEVIDSIKEENPELASVCVPECVYRGMCPEPNGCGYEKTKRWGRVRRDYEKTCYENKNQPKD